MSERRVVLPSLPTSRTFRVLAVAGAALVLFGICIRFVNLDRKMYTNDEATASLHVSGHTIDQYAAAVFDGRPRTAEQLLAFQRGDGATTLGDVVSSLAVEDARHPPLFYVAERLWTDAFGASVAARRSVSAIAGSLAIAAVAWLAWELFGGVAAPLACAALYAISPFAVVYAQQTREYALWSLLCAAAGAALLAALRTGTALAWAAYAALAALGLYTDALFLGTVAAHAVYALVVRLERGAARGYALASLAALAAFAPWFGALRTALTANSGTANAFVGVLNAGGNNTFLAVAVPAKVFALKWFFNAGAVFFDLDYRWHAAAVLAVPLVAFAGYAAYRLVRDTPRRTWVLAVAPGAVVALALLVPDVLFHESRSTAARYLVPLWLALDLATGWYLARLCTANGRARAFGVTACAAFACAGVASCVVGNGARVWWADSSVAPLVPVARALAASPGALVSYRATWSRRGGPNDIWDFAVMQLVNVVPPSVRFRQLPVDAPPLAVVAGATTFVLDPTGALRAALAAAGRPLLPAALPGRAAGEGAVAALRREARALRRAAGVVDFDASLWRPSTAR